MRPWIWTIQAAPPPHTRKGVHGEVTQPHTYRAGGWRGGAGVRDPLLLRAAEATRTVSWLHRVLAAPHRRSVVPHPRPAPPPPGSGIGGLRRLVSSGNALATFRKDRVKYFEDFVVGERHELGSHTMTGDEILTYARRYDPQPFHIDPEAARRSIFGGLIASGWHTCAVLMRLSVEDQRRTQAAGIGSPGVDSVRWLKPVRAGDTLAGTTEILETWPSRSKPMGFVRRRSEMANQHGDVVLRLVGISMYQSRRGAS